MHDTIIWFDQLGMDDLEKVGGKNASLGEMINHLTETGVKIPNGFATTAQAFRDFLSQNDLHDKIFTTLNELDIEDVSALAKTGQQIRQWVNATPFSSTFTDTITTAYQKLQESDGDSISVAVRSSATAEDLPDASFAGQQETYLNIAGIDNVLTAIKAVFASLFTDRAIAYRVHQGFPHDQVAISAGIQHMVRSDKAASGVLFTLDTESGFDKVVFITAAYGLGETIVQGSVNPDEFYVYKPGLSAKRSAILRRNLGDKGIKMVYADTATTQHLGSSITTTTVSKEDRQKFCLNDEEIQHLAKQAMLIEQHYKRPMDIEWAKDGITGELYILQARPETVKSRTTKQAIERYRLEKPASESDIIITGRSIGQRIGQGQAKILKSASEMAHLNKNDVLVTDMTDPDWEPIMKKASAIVTNRGGRTCHAAIIARELGIPAIVGCGDATDKITDGDEVTVSCAKGDVGFVYRGLLDFKVNKISIDKMPTIPLEIMMNVGNPDRAFDFQRLPNAGVGLARLEFIISNTIGIHPKALLNYTQLPEQVKTAIDEKIQSYGDPVEFYVERLKEGIATIAAAFYPKTIIVRLSDFKTNEYANLLGGDLYEPHEENPMLGFRGASRYIDDSFRDCFELECQALKRVRDDMGLDNVAIMVPFVRTLSEAKQVIDLLAEQGLKRGENKLKLIMMCEVPSNALLADDFLEYFDGFSIGSNDLTQLTLGLDRDSSIIAQSFDERDKAVKVLLHQAISACKKAGKYIGICGQGPSDHPDFAKWLLEEGIESVSLNPDSVLDTWLYLAEQQ